MYKIPHSLPDRTFTEVVSRWLIPICQNESVSVLNVSKSSQWHYIQQLLSRGYLLKKFFSRLSDIQFVTLDIHSFPLDNADEFQIYMDETFIKNKKRIIIFVQGAEYLLHEKLELLGYFDKLNRSDKISFLFFLKTNITLPRIIKHYSVYDVLYQNVIAVPLYKNEDIHHFILHEASRYKIKLPSHLVDQIALTCGGRMMLAKQAVRYYSRTKSDKNIFNHEEMKIKLRTIYEELEPEEKDVLNKIVANNSSFDTDEKQIINYFISVNLVLPSQHGYSITIPLLESYIHNLNRRKLDIFINKNNLICVNGVIIDSIFSKREEKLLKEFIRKRNEIISRENTAALLWNEDYSQQYTDWALDMSIKRLRHKLELIGLDKGIIKTKRNIGFIFM